MLHPVFSFPIRTRNVDLFSLQERENCCFIRHHIFCSIGQIPLNHQSIQSPDTKQSIIGEMLSPSFCFKYHGSTPVFFSRLHAQPFYRISLKIQQPIYTGLKTSEIVGKNPICEVILKNNPGLTSISKYSPKFNLAAT